MGRIARSSVASESNTNLAMHLGAITQWISRVHAWVRPIINAMLWGTLGISSDRRVTVFGLPSDTERHRTNARLITWQNKPQYSFLWVVADLCSGGFSSGFSCCFHGKYRYDSTYARFKRRTLHVPNLMQMSENNRFSSFALDSAHVKFDVWNGP